MGVVVFLLIALRFLLVFTPQIGYIHPDEFFQSVEVVAGDVLDIDVHKAWEFNSSMPIRSISFPYMMAGLPITALKYLQDKAYITITAYWMLVLPRLWMTLLSVITDLSVYVMCKTFDFNANFAMKLYACSYIALVYMSRTFSNSLESVFVALFFIFLLRSTVIPEEKRIWNKAKTNKNIYLKTMSPFSWILMGILLTAGFFNRPSFLFFIEVPFLFWYLILVKPLELRTAVKYHFQMKLSLTVGLLLALVTLVGIDTWYYEPDSAKTFFSDCSLCMNKDVYPMFTCLSNVFLRLVVAPYNFLAYNFDVGNLATHGLHPRYLHFLVNVPLLLGPLVLPIYYTLFNMPLSYVRGKFQTDSRIVYLSFTFFFPVLFLSYYQHQEPRFLIPLIPVACVLTSGILGSTKARKILWAVWIIFNIAATLFYGYMHQGGVVPAVMDASEEMAARPKVGNSRNDHLIFYRTYMPPQYLLLSKDVKVIDLAGGPPESISKTLDSIMKTEPKSKVQVFTPATVYDSIKRHLGKTARIEMICPHISMENPPNFLRFIKSLDKWDEHLSELCINIIHINN